MSSLVACVYVAELPEPWHCISIGQFFRTAFSDPGKAEEGEEKERERKGVGGCCDY